MRNISPSNRKPSAAGSGYRTEDIWVTCRPPYPLCHSGYWVLLFILIYIMLSRSIICSKFRIACQFQLFPFWMIQPNEIWTNPTNKSPMQKAKLATVQIQNDYRKPPSQTVQTSCTKAANNNAQRIRKGTAVKIASAKIVPAKMRRKFPNRGKMPPQPNHETKRAWGSPCFSLTSPA